VLERFLAPFLARVPARLDAGVSIGMAAHGNARTTQKALDDLFCSASGDFELVLVDDRSPDDTLEVFRAARRRHRNTRIFAFRENLEYCQSVNAFLSHAKGELLLFLSNDIFANPTYLRELARAARRHPDCGILRGSSNFVDNASPLHNLPAGEFDSQDAYFDFCAQVARRYGGTGLIDDPYLFGDAFLVRRAVLRKVGTFDTRFVGYYGDADFGLRARLAGFRLALAQSAFAFHQRDANVLYLPPEEQRVKIARRQQRVSRALAEFVRKYDLKLTAAAMHKLPWDELARRAFDERLHYVAPKDYSSFEFRE
jgi:GT2 family glycosyltransferase